MYTLDAANTTEARHLGCQIISDMFQQYEDTGLSLPQNEDLRSRVSGVALSVFCPIYPFTPSPSICNADGARKVQTGMADERDAIGQTIPLADKVLEDRLDLLQVHVLDLVP